MCAPLCWPPYTVYDRIDTAATINFSTQFGVATIRERRLFESGIYFIRRRYRLKKNREHKHKDSVLVLLRASESGIQGHRQILSGVHVNIDGSEVVWQSQPRARSSISHYALEAGSTRLAWKMDTYITSNMSELPRCSRGEIPANPCMCVHVRNHTHSCFHVPVSASRLYIWCVHDQLMCS